MPSKTSGASRQSHRANVKVGGAIPRPLRYGIGAAALTVALVGSLSVANATNEATTSSPDAVADVNDVTGRNDVWAQVSRGDGYRESLLDEGVDPVDFTVVVDGQTVELSSSANTLADALIEAGISVDLDDVVSAPMGEPPAQDAQISVTRFGTQLDVEVTEIPFETEERRTSSLPSGTTQVQTEGTPGSVVTTYESVYSNGEVTSRTELTSVVAAQPTNRVVLVGTGTTPRPSGSGSGSTPSLPSGTYSGSDPRAIAQNMLGAYGWGMDQWSCLNSLWQKESNWNPYARNRSSGAYGIPQSLPGSKMASAGSDWRTNPATQIKWGLGYIQNRYGSPCGAWGHSQSRGWY
ncbi:MAG: G5 domain-containing protein [Beutenbergiaceae bacterium]